MEEKAKVKCEFHALMLADKGFIYRLNGTRKYYAFKDPNNVPENMFLVFHQSFKTIRRECGWIVKNGSIEDQYADLMTWTERGLRIVCVTGTLEHNPDLGEWEALTGDIYRWD